MNDRRPAISSNLNTLWNERVYDEPHAENLRSIRRLCRRLHRHAHDGRPAVPTLAGQQPPAPRAENPNRVLAGAIDIHVHSTPDDRERSVDALDAAILARANGMRAIVLKNHYDPTAGLAYMVRKQVAGVEVFGGVDLNLPVGGMNPAAVEHMTRVSGGYGRIVWMSTFDAENQVKYSKENRPFVSVSKNGELLPATKEVVAVIAKRNLVLATGHVSADEGLMLLRDAKRQGVQRMVVTHAMNAPIQMSVAQMQEAAKQGAFLEFVGGTMLSADAPARVDRFADAIRRVGTGVLHSLERSGTEGQSAAGGRIRGVHPGPQGAWLQRSGPRSHVEAEPGEAAGLAVSGKGVVPRFDSPVV